MSRKKKQVLENVLVSAYAAEGKCIVRTEEGKVIFVDKVVPGDRIDLMILKDKKSYSEGRAMRIRALSPDRVEPFCPHFGVCGGCKWQMLPYERQLVYKEQQVHDQLRRISHVELPAFDPISGSPQDTYYRNKLEFTFSTHRYRTHEELQAAGDAPLAAEPALGFHAPGLFDKVVPIHVCFLQGDPTNKLLQVLRDYSEANRLPYYDFHAQRGWLRNVVLRVTTTGGVLVNMVFGPGRVGQRNALLDHLLRELPEITSLHYTVNPKVNDSIHDLDVVCYAGEPYITETLEDFTFHISPKSFFQTNSRQAEALYRFTRDFAGLTGSEVLYDLYCGTGTIGIFCGRQAGRLVGIELVAEAIADARENAALNGIDNAHFYSGDVAQLCTDEFFAEHGKPDVIITDPPRAGMHESLIRQLLRMEAPRIVYVSCNPATQARDLQLLDPRYRVTRVQPVDMFPHTHHIENIVLLELRQE